MLSFESHVSTESDYYVYNPSSLAKKLFFYPVCTGHFIYEPGYYLKRNNYDSFLIMYITRGSCTVTLSDIILTAAAGEVVFLDCYVPHQYTSETGWESYWLHFDGPMSRDYYEQISYTFGNVLIPINAYSVEHALSKIYSTFRSNASISETSISRYITDILTELLHSGAKKDRASSSRLSLADTISYINEHFAEPISLNDLAKQASLSLFYFTRTFTKETGMSPHQYIIALRISAAKFLLKTTTIPVKEIGFTSGFASESSFCTTFKKWEYRTPSEYRIS